MYTRTTDRLRTSATHGHNKAVVDIRLRSHLGAALGESLYALQFMTILSIYAKHDMRARLSRFQETGAQHEVIITLHETEDYI